MLTEYDIHHTLESFVWLAVVEGEKENSSFPKKVYDLFHSIRVLLLLPTSTTHATHQEQDEQIWIQIEFIENCGKNISIKISFVKQFF